MPRWARFGGTDDDDSPPTRFILDNNIDISMLKTLQGLGVSAVLLPMALRKAPDDAVLAEAKRKDRVLITHDRRFVNPHEVEPDQNPGIIVLPSDGRGNLDWNLILGFLQHAYVYRNGVDQTVSYVYPSGRVTIWNPNEYTGEMEPVFCRLTDHGVEVWLDDDDLWGSDPAYEN
ncbi:MAG TPA: DUF5615 family PIN-like protein [Candidatus Cybelea sp.]|nr:DUF5615 family PIN-like protein [Candidatus Cybelea sp.]